MADPWVLGVAASHNGGACLLRGDRLVVAIQEERLTRLKRARVWGAERTLSIRYCLAAAGISDRDIDAIGFTSPRPMWESANRIEFNPDLERAVSRVPVIRVAHHRAHALAAVVTSGLAEATVMIIDGAGSGPVDLDEDERQVASDCAADSETISIYHADPHAVVPLAKEMGFWLRPRRHGMPSFGSLGGMYSAVAHQIFGDAMEAGKVMGLAPYGHPVIAAHDFVQIDGWHTRFPTTVADAHPHDDRWPTAGTTYQDLAASVQHALEEAVLTMAGEAMRLGSARSLCYAGGVALNCVANEKLITQLGVGDVSIMAAAEDSGTCLGAAYHALWTTTGRRARRGLRRDSTGQRYGTADIEAALDAVPVLDHHRSDDPVRDAARRIADGALLGWFRGGSELGPRALGQRSILADPRSPDTKDRLNQRVKGREPFRPFAPVVPLEDAPSWFRGPGPFDSPFMLRSCAWQEAQINRVPGVVHVDGTGRLQTVEAGHDLALWSLLQAFGELTGTPVLLNTSFNLAGDPIVETPLDALWCLLASGLDGCVIEDFVVTRRESATDLSCLTVTRAYQSLIECRSQRERPRAAVGLSDLGLRTPVACTERPEQVFASVAGDRWLRLEYCLVSTNTPWGPVHRAIDAPEGRLLGAVDGPGITCRRSHRSHR